MVFAKNDCLSWTRESPQMTSSGGRFRSSEGTPRKLLSIPLLEMSFVFCIHNIYEGSAVGTGGNVSTGIQTDLPEV